MEPEKTVETSSVDSSIPYPENPEAMAENIQESRVEAAEELTHAKTNQSEAEPEYPTLKKLIPSAIALYLAFFLVALVDSHPVPYQTLLMLSGPHNHRNRYSYHHR